MAFPTNLPLTHENAKQFAINNEGRLATFKEYFPDGKLYPGSHYVNMTTGDKWAPISDTDNEWV